MRFLAGESCDSAERQWERGAGSQACRVPTHRDAWPFAHTPARVEISL